MVRKELLDLKFRGIIEKIKDNSIPKEIIYEIDMMIQDASDIGYFDYYEDNKPIILDEESLKKEGYSKMEIWEKRLDLLNKRSEERIPVPPSNKDIQSNIREKLVGNSVRVLAYIDKLSSPEVDTLKTRNIITGELYGKSIPKVDFKRWTFDLIKVFQVNGVYLDINDVDLGSVSNFETISFDDKILENFEYDVMTFDLIEGKVIKYLGETRDHDYHMVNLQITKLGNIKLFNISRGRTEELGLSLDGLRYMEDDIRANEERIYYVVSSEPPDIGRLYRGRGIYQRDKTNWWYFIDQIGPIMQNGISQIV